MTTPEQPARRKLAPAVRKITPARPSHYCHQIAGLYDLEETLGKGHFATVKAARHVFTGEKVAVKVIDKSKLSPAHTQGLLKEILCMKLVQHPNVVRLYEVIDTTSKMYLVLELGNGDLYDIIQKQPAGLGSVTSRRYFNQILSAVSYCHKLHVVHRDLKPENVVYFNSGGGCLKLTDFGFSNCFDPGVKLDTSCGSLCYSAPEILLGDSYDAPAVDIWSLGVILYMLVTGHAPFQEANDSETLTMIMDVKYSFPEKVDPLCCDLIGAMLIREPEQRADLSKIKSHAWLEGCDPIQEDVLISGIGLDEKGKRHVIGQMVEGAVVADSEEVESALSSNAYNYITSTYYLLAEKYLKERVALAEPSLTSSLESLHDKDKRKNSGISSDTDTASDEDSLAGLDLETGSGGSGKKGTPRYHTGIDFERTIVEEGDEESTELEPLAISIRPHSSHNVRHRIYIRPQRSTSCSSSEDEEKASEKKKHKSKQSHKPDNIHYRDDEEDDPSGGGNPAAGTAVVPPLYTQAPSLVVSSPPPNDTSQNISTTKCKRSVGRFLQWFFHRNNSDEDGGKIYKSKSCADLKINEVRTDFNMNM